jgi:hypothetical protein
MQFDRSATVANREELFGGISGLHEQLSGSELNVLAATGNQRPVGWRKVFEERVFGK